MLSFCFVCLNTMVHHSISTSRTMHYKKKKEKSQFLSFVHCYCSDVNNKVTAHHPTTPVIVQIHLCTSIFPHLLPSIYEGLSKLYAIVDIVAASTPVETAIFVTVLPTLVAVTIAAVKFPLTAGPGDGINHSS